MIAQYTLDTHRKVLKLWYEKHKNDTNIRSIEILPAAVIGAFFICDGQPAAQLSKIIAADKRKYS